MPSNKTVPFTDHTSQPPNPLSRGEGLQILGLVVGEDGDEVYKVSFREAATAELRDGELRHTGEGSWDLHDLRGGGHSTLALGHPDEVFARALGHAPPTSAAMANIAPRWPAAVQTSLARRLVSGAGCIAFDGAWFISMFTTSPIDRPLLLPDAVSRLGLTGLARAREVICAAAAGGGDDLDLVELLRRALAAERGVDTGHEWAGEGRLIGESTWGDLSQVGADIGEGCQAALGTGLLQVRFDPDLPMGLGFAPRVPSAATLAGRSEGSAGTGLEVGEVDPGEAGDRAGVQPGMVLVSLAPGEELLGADGVSPMTFEEVLEAIDDRRDAGEELLITFDTAAPLTHLYAVEMPAASALAALAALRGDAREPADVGVGASFNALCGGALLWREPTPRLFLGAGGSITCAHTDICPQLQLAHGLLGAKILGVASHEATPRLRAAHAGGEGDIDEGATFVPTDRALSPQQARLLGDDDVTLVLLQEGDLAVFDSGALHFASNGASGLSGAIYHGVITPAAVPRLRAAAAAEGGSHSPGDGAYGEHMFAADLLKEVAPQLSKFEAEDKSH